MKFSTTILLAFLASAIAAPISSPDDDSVSSLASSASDDEVSSVASGHRIADALIRAAQNGVLPTPTYVRNC